MLKDIGRNSPNGFLRSTREDSVAQLLEHCRANPRQTIRKNGRSSHRHRSAANSSSSVNVHRIDNSLEIERNLYIEDLHARKNYQHGLLRENYDQGGSEPLRLRASLRSDRRGSVC